MIEKHQRIIEKWIGTPYEYMGNTARKGVDCIHLVQGILKDLGISIPLPPYQEHWAQQDAYLFERQLDAYQYRWEEIKEKDVQFGDVILIRADDSIIKHAGVATDSAYFLHVMDDAVGAVRLDRIGRVRNAIAKIIRVNK
jgi:cell wall-associated NlpC family hydrolase